MVILGSVLPQRKQQNSQNIKKLSLKKYYIYMKNIFWRKLHPLTNYSHVERVRHAHSCAFWLTFTNLGTNLVIKPNNLYLVQGSWACSAIINIIWKIFFLSSLFSILDIYLLILMCQRSNSGNESVTFAHACFQTCPCTVLLNESQHLQLLSSGEGHGDLNSLKTWSGSKIPVTGERR